MGSNGTHRNAPRRRLSALVATTLVAAGVVLPGTASAQGPTRAADVSGQSVSFSDLGRPSDLPLTSTAAPITVTVPVPDGLQARELTGILSPPADLRQGWVEIRALDGRVVQRVDIPAGVDAGIPLSVPLANLEVVDRSVTVTIASHVLPIDDRCYDRSTFAPLTLRDAAVAYDGDERQPTVPADFLPAVLRVLTIYVADPTSPAEQDAALGIGAAVVSYFGAQPTRVDIAELPEGGALPEVAPALFERTIVLGGPGEPGIRLESTATGASVLRIAGDEASLPSQVDLFVSDLGRHAAASGAIAATTSTVPEMAQDVVSLAQLKIGSLTSSGLDRIEVPILVNQTQIGRPIRDLSAHLFGTYVPLPASRSGMLSVRVGDTPLVTAPLDPSGKFDLRVSVPNDQLTRFMTLTVTLDVTGDLECGADHSTSLTVDPRSTISSVLATPPAPGGFASLPQALLPTVDIGLGSNDLDDLQRANRLLTLMQRTSYLPLQPRVRPLTEAAASTLPAILVSADGNVPQSVRAPLGSADPAVLALRGVTGTTDYGSLQVLEQGGRTVVLATSNGEVSDLDALLGWLEADSSRFPKLGGDVLIAARDAEPFVVSVRVADVAAQAAVEHDAGIGAGALVAIVAGTTVLAVVVVGTTVWLRRRRP